MSVVARCIGLTTCLALAACDFSADFDGTRYRCGVGDTCPSGFACVAGVCEPEGGGDPDGPLPPSEGTWRSDSADDFAAAGHVAIGAAIDRRGALEPYAYYTGGVIVRGAAGAITSSAATWDQVAAFSATPVVAIARSTDVSWSSAAPPGVGLVDGNDWSLRFEGEIWLEAGDWTFSMLADDHGFLDVDRGGGFARVASADYPDEASGVVQVAAADWFPIRWVASDDLGNASMRVRLQGPGVPAAIAIPRHRLRARVDMLDGLVLTGFAGERLAGRPETTIDAVAPADVDWNLGAPLDLGLTRVDDFSTRWSGQVLIEVEGTYYLRYVSDDGQRLWVDGARVLDAWDDVSHERVTPPLALTAGWHDLVIDHSEHVGSAEARVTIDSGPALSGQPLAAARLRPVEGRGERFESGGNSTDVTLPDAPSTSVDGIASSTMTVTAPPGAVVSGLQVGFTYDHEWQGDLRILLIAPDGRMATLRNATGSAAGTITEVHDRTDLDGAPAAGTWTLRFIDIDPGAAGVLRDVRLTLHTRDAGELPVSTLALFESAPRDLGGESMIEAVRWAAITPTGSTVRVEVRTCATAATCADSAWVPVPAGSTPAIPPGAFGQFRVLLTSDGDHVPSLEWIEIDHS